MNINGDMSINGDMNKISVCFLKYVGNTLKIDNKSILRILFPLSFPLQLPSLPKNLREHPRPYIA
jgi:hypothetical protein